MSKKRKIPKKTRRKIFYLCCVIAALITILVCINSFDNDESKSVEIVVADTSAVLATEPPAKENRYTEINIEAWELDEMAAIIYLEARNQSAKGQQAIAEVILNRVLNEGFSNSISEVIHEGESKGVVQFTTVTKLSEAKPTETQYKAINAALYGEPVLPLDVVFFSRNGENDNVWGKIDDHVFCYAYKWE